ncbi:hypothetical protein ACSBO6_09700 [Bacillus sp. AL-1R]
MYKKIKLFMLTSLAFFLLVPSVFADEETNIKKKEVVIFKAKEISDKNVLLSRAKTGITDNSEMDENMNTLMEVKDKNGKSVHISKKDVKITTQKLKTVKKEKNTVVESYVTTVFSEASFERKNGEISTLEYDIGKGALDPTLSVYSYSRVYYNIIMVGTVKHYDLVKATGYWTLQDATTGIKNTNVTLQQYGYTNVGGNRIVNGSQKFDVGTSFTVNADPDWVPVFKYTGSVVNAVQRCTITEGSSSWSATFINNVF